MTNKDMQQPIPKELKDAQLDAVTGGQDVDAAIMEKINAEIDAVKNAPSCSSPSQTGKTLEFIHLTTNVNLVVDAANQIVPQPPELQRQPFEVSPWEGVRTESPEDALWTKK